MLSSIPWLDLYFVGEVSFMEGGSCGRRPDLGEGEGHEFSLRCAEFEWPLRHLSGDIE